MALTDIIQTLLEQAQQNAAKITAQIETDKKNIKAQYDADEKTVMAEIDAKKTDGQVRLNRETQALVAKEKRKFALDAKSRIMKKSLELFYESLVNLSDADYKTLLSALIAHMQLRGTGVVYAPAKRLALTSEVLPSGFQAQASDELTGGIIIEQGKAQIDARFKNLVYSQFKTEIEAFFAQKLNLID